MTRTTLGWLVSLPMLWVSGLQAADGTVPGRIEGRLVGPDGRGIAGASVVIADVAPAVVTGVDGAFIIDAVPADRHQLVFTLEGEQPATLEVTVVAGETTEIEKKVSWRPAFTETITVVSASRRRERLIDAPAAVTAVLEEEISRKAAHGQLPKLLEFTPGVELTQSGLFDFNLNVRGFNTSLNRRTLVLIDGRDPSLPFLGAQDWASFSRPLDEIESVELVRGPSSALYGADAVNGVINVVTKPLADQRGGRFRLTAGEQSTKRIDSSHAGAIGDSWFFRLTGGYQDSGDFSRSRNESVEYEGVPLEAVPLGREGVRLTMGSFRLDRSFEVGDGEATLSLEAGDARTEGPTFIGNGGRSQAIDSRRPWARARYLTPRWELSLAETQRDGRDLVVLTSGGKVFEFSERTQLEARHDRELAGGATRFLAGIAYSRLDIDTRRTVLFEPYTEERVGAYAQLDRTINDKLRALVALRWDDSDRFESKLSPKIGLVFAPRLEHTLRLTYNEAFQAPNSAEIFVSVRILPSLDLSHIERELAPLLGGVPLGFEEVPFLALGNTGLSPESARTVEVGYHGVWSKLAVSVDLYSSTLEDFVSSLLPQLGTSLGRVNPEFGPYQPPSGLSAEASAAVLAALERDLGPALFALLSNHFDDAPILATLSFTNAGRATTQGAELSLAYSFSPRLQAHMRYSYSDFEIEEQVAESPILANAPENQLSAGLAYLGPRFDITLDFRWNDDFEWLGGVYVGPVPSYQVVDLVTNYRLDERWRFGVNVANLLDEEHYEIFGGDLLGRRLLGHVTLSW